MLDSQTTDSQAVEHLLQTPLPGCQHVLLATADFMGIRLATDHSTPTPEPLEEESNVVEPSQRVQLPTPEPEESQILKPVESLYHKFLQWAHQ